MKLEDEDNIKMLRKINNNSIKEVEPQVELSPINSNKKDTIDIKANQHLIEEKHDDGHNHAHDHHKQGNAHDNKRHKGHDHSQPGKKNYCIIFYTMFTCISCLYLQTEQLNPLLGDSKSTLMTFICYFDVFMCLFSYIQAMRIKSTATKLQGNYQVENLDEKLYDKAYDLYSKKCDKCNYFKFPRVSHCSSCGECIYKLDHHCIWTQTCIGYCNHRPFYLFCVYMTIGVLQFWYSTIRVMSKLIETCAFFSAFEPGVYILWFITCVSAGFVGMMIIGLFLSHSLMIITNYTTLDSIKTKKMCELPFCEFRKSYFDNISHFNRGQIQNSKSLFGSNILTCWLPFGRQVENEFIFEAMNPYPSKLQLMKFSDLYKQEVNYQKQVQKYTIGFKGIYKGKKMRFNNQIYEV